MPTNQEFHRKIADLKCCVIIPTYNNEQTLEGVIRDLQLLTGNIIVVNDGSTDGTTAILGRFPELAIISSEVNRGKGRALQLGFALALEKGYRYAITIDSDGQHKPADIPRFLELIEKEPESLIIGSRNMDSPAVPGSSRFGHRFSIFWFRIETGLKVADVQSGFRLYPLEKIRETGKFYTGKYEFEVEVLVRLAWKGVKILSIPIEVYYAPEETRVSHFRKGTDFTRTSILNAILVFMALLWVRPFMFAKGLKKKSVKGFIKEYVVDSSYSNTKLTLSVMLGLFIGVLPVWGWQMMVAFGLAHFFRLNKFVTVAASNISIPPMLPLILYLSYKAGGWVVGTKTAATRLAPGFNYEWIKANFVQYLVGSIIFGIILSVALSTLTYLLLQIFRKPKPSDF
jgi:glycosyltransferase involved in cell wall biosynthesis